MTAQTTAPTASTGGGGHYGVPGMSAEDSTAVARILQDRLNALTDLHLTLKHVHWNVVGSHFIGIHEMLDPQVKAVRKMSDAVAERIATLGQSPVGTPGALVAARSWDDYSIGRAGALEHMGALDLVYSGVIGDHRAAIEGTDELDPITNDMLIGQSTDLEQFQWFVRAHLENSAGELSTAGAQHESEATELAAAGEDETA